MGTCPSGWACGSGSHGHSGTMAYMGCSMRQVALADPRRVLGLFLVQAQPLGVIWTPDEAAPGSLSLAGAL